MSYKLISIILQSRLSSFLDIFTLSLSTKILDIFHFKKPVTLYIKIKRKLKSLFSQCVEQYITTSSSDEENRQKNLPFTYS